MAIKKVKFANYNTVKNQISAGKLPPVIVLVGNEDYLIKDLVKRVYSALLPPGTETMDLAKYHLQGKSEAIDFAKLEADIVTPAFLAPRKLVHLQNAGLFAQALNTRTGSKDDWEKLLCLLNDGVVLLLTETRASDERSVRQDNVLLKLISQAGGLVAKLDKQSDDILVNWLSAQCRQCNLSLPRVAAESLISRYEGSMTLLQQALRSLILYLEFTGEKEITQALVEHVCRSDLTGTVFELSDALAANRVDRALAIYARLNERREPALYILAAVSSLMRRLFIAKEYRSAVRLLDAGVTTSSFYAGKLVRLSTRYSSEKLFAIIEDCYQADLAIKTGILPEQEAMTVMLVNACKAGA